MQGRSSKTDRSVGKVIAFGLVTVLTLWSGSSRASDWPKYCANLEMTGISNSPEISRPTIGELALRWKAELDGSVASSPTVRQGILYIGDWSGSEWAIRASTGEVLAVANLGQTTASQCNPPRLGITSSPAVAGGEIFLAGGDDGFYCLDARTLEIRWRVSLGDHSASGGYYGWSSPSVVESRVLQGISSNCDTPFIPGALVALDAATGAISGRADLVSPGQLGGGVWTSPAVDLESRSIFVSTASALHWSDGFAYSIVRLSLDGLAVLDSWKLNPVVVPDADWGSSPTLFTDRNGRRLVGAGQKDGNYYAFDRKSLSQGPVWKAPIAEGGDCPQCGDGTLSTAASDGSRLFVGGGRPPGAPSGTSGSSVVALDPAEGHLLWRSELPSGPVIAPVSYANGIVFAVAGNLAVALDAEDGGLLWAFDTGSLGYGGIAIAEGRIFFGDLSGSLYSFGVPASDPATRSLNRSERSP